MPDRTRRAPPTPDPLLPRGAMLLDLLVIVLVLLAVSAYATGGFRTVLFGVRISATSFARLAFVAGVVAAVRHLWRRSPWIGQSAAQAFMRWRRDDVTRATWPVLVTTRLGVLLVGLLAVSAIGYPQGAPPFKVAESELGNLPARFDAGWYMTIADDGYDYSPGRVTRQQNLVFFPAFPALMHALSLLVARQLAWSGTLVSVLAFMWALRYLYRLAREVMDADRALVAVTLAATYPFAVFFSAPYTEGLFMAAMLGAWWHLRRDERWPAFAWGLMAGLTRPNGCLLSIPLALTVLSPLWRHGRLQPPAGGWLAVSDRLVVAAAPGLGMLLYSAYVYDLTGDPFMWVRLQAAWGRENRGLVAFAEGEWQALGERGLYQYATGDVPNFFNALAGSLAVVSLIPIWRRFGLPTMAIVGVNLLPSLATGGWLSVGRATSVLFPIFLWLADAVPVRHRLLWVGAFAALQAFAAALFFTWRQLF
jgi:Mannosyltransferase (PIG-V)